MNNSFEFEHVLKSCKESEDDKFDQNQKFTFTDLIHLINLKSKYDPNDEISYKLFLAWKQGQIILQENINKELADLVRRGKNLKDKSLKEREKMSKRSEKGPQDVKFDFNKLLREINEMKISNKVQITQIYGDGELIRQEG